MLTELFILHTIMLILYRILTPVATRMLVISQALCL